MAVMRSSSLSREEWRPPVLLQQQWRGRLDHHQNRQICAGKKGGQKRCLEVRTTPPMTLVQREEKDARGPFGWRRSGGDWSDDSEKRRPRPRRRLEGDAGFDAGRRGRERRRWLRPHKHRKLRCDELFGGAVLPWNRGRDDMVARKGEQERRVEKGGILLRWVIG
ncbi:hypothetical protein PIB30_036175 [Stylosanthes scabra]|uniref:Uncharacterized protein n=1 Tax=Stylosanthes scabra TaxID=79078 RepID=A0ABU6QEQ7_9FABA|nr:hypothetical protein [Stylosanthes scabra]